MDLQHFLRATTQKPGTQTASLQHQQLFSSQPEQQTAVLLPLKSSLGCVHHLQPNADAMSLTVRATATPAKMTHPVAMDHLALAANAVQNESMLQTVGTLHHKLHSLPMKKNLLDDGATRRWRSDLLRPWVAALMHRIHKRLQQQQATHDHNLRVMLMTL